MTEYIERRYAVDAVVDVYYDTPDIDLSGEKFEAAIFKIPVADVAPVRHGRWILESNKDKVNCRWNVTAECSNCCDEKKEIWAGFFPNVPDWLARDTALIDAKSVKLNNYCPNCGAKMDGGDNNSDICSKTI